MNKKIAAQFAEEQISKRISKQEVYEYLVNNNDLGHKVNFLTPFHEVVLIIHSTFHKVNKNIVREFASNENKLKFKNINYILISILIILFVLFFNFLINNLSNLLDVKPENNIKYLIYLLIYIFTGIFFIRSIYQFKFGNHLAAFISLPLLCLRMFLNLGKQPFSINLIDDVVIIILSVIASIIGLIIHKNVFDSPKVSK